MAVVEMSPAKTRQMKCSKGRNDNSDNWKATTNYSANEGAADRAQ